jgi:hypothetical protein
MWALMVYQIIFSPLPCLLLELFLVVRSNYQFEICSPVLGGINWYMLWYFSLLHCLLLFFLCLCFLLPG